MISEEKTPGVDNTKQVTKQSGDSNDEYYKEVDSKMKEYDDDIRSEEDETVKFNADDKQKEYHDQMEIRNGQEMIRYDQEPSKQYKDRAEKALKGDTTMGNKTHTGKWNPETGEGNGNTEPVWGASDEKFGEKLINTAKASQKKREDATPSITQFGDDIELNKEKKEKAATQAGKKKYAFESLVPQGSELGAGYTHFAINKSTGKIVNGWDYAGVDKEDIKTFSKEDLISDFPENKIGDFKLVTRKRLESDGVDVSDTKNWYKVKTDNDNKIHENKTTMKKLTFKKEFGGVEKAISLIPEHFKKDDQELILTDLNETYHIRWEGNVNEGEAIVLSAENKKMIKEEKEKMGRLWNFNSKDTLGTLKAKDRIKENEEFSKIWSKSKDLLK